MYVKGAGYSDNFKAGSKVNEITAVWTAWIIEKEGSLEAKLVPLFES